ncbi:aldo/keto reductase [Planomonospora sp. ID82291]|uniref:aldo/keto reductase n=1 Tax=Planomonospora sp. ID82291 TaxID=2738136 RepID=UPI0018C44BC3|nr:aldo/keto reductase [Planomonospora sp. ID82291]MBG0813179.1 aldo/keto reductase [Planomonospora sp. ID82291]
MRYTTLGPAGPVVSAVGLGTLALSGAYGPVEPREAGRLVHRALDAGVTLLDTAGFYAGGRVESLIGRVLAGRAEEVVVCTRGGVRVGGPGDPVVFDGRPHELERSLHASLKRLRADCVDLFSLHCQDTRVPVEKSVAGLAELVRAGKIRRLGLSGGTAEQVRRAHAVHAVSAVGVEYSLWGPPPSPELLAAVRELGIAVIAARPLGRGFLTGRVRPQSWFEPGDWRRADPRFRPGHRRGGCSRLRELESAAARLDLGAGRVALSWLSAQGEHVIPVPSTRDPVHLEMNLAASSVELPAETLDRLDGLFPAARCARPSSPLL